MKKQQKKQDHRIVPLARKPRKTIVPPPTKAEVTEALVVAEVRARTAKASAARERMEALGKEIMVELRKHIGENSEKFLNLMCATMPYTNGTDDLTLSGVHLSTKEISVEFTQKVAQYNQLAAESHPPYVDMRALRRRMRDAIRLDHKRVDALSKSNEVGQMLAAIHGFKPLTPNHHNGND